MDSMKHLIQNEIIWDKFHFKFIINLDQNKSNHVKTLCIFISHRRRQNRNNYTLGLAYFVIICITRFIIAICTVYR